MTQDFPEWAIAARASGAGRAGGGAAPDLARAKAAPTQVRKDAAANGGSFELVELDLS